jgi:hypothetical protein
MAEKRTIELEVKDNVKSLKAQYKEAVVELQRVSAAYGETSAEAIRAAKAAAELKDQIGFTNDMVSSFNPDGKFNALSKSFGGVLDGFQAVEGGLGLIGVEGEAVQEAMLRVQSAMAFSQGVQGVLEAKDSFKQLGANIKDVYLQIFKKNAATTAGAAVDKANVVTTGAQAVASSGLATAQTGVAVSTGVASNAMKLFRIALIATGIGAIVVAVGLLIANFDKVTQAVMWAREKFEKLGTGVKILISIMFPFIGIIYGTIKALEAMGLVDDVNTAKMKKNAQEHTEAVIKNADKRAKAIKKEQTQNDAKAQREIELAKASGKATYEMELSKAKAHLASGRVYLEVQKSKMKAIKAEMDLLLATEDQDSDRYKELKKRAEGVRKIMDETYKDNVDTNHSIKIMQAEHNKEMADKAKEAGDKAKQTAEQNRKAYIDNLKKQYDDQSKLEEEAENQKLALMEDGIAKEKALRQDAYNDYRDNFLKERIADEQEALNKQYESGKISREEYNKQLEALRVNAESKLTEQERQILVNAKDLLNKDLLAIDEKHQAEVLKRTQDFQKKVQDEEKKRNEDFLNQVEGLQELNYQASLTDQKRELYLIDEKYAEMERMAKGNADAEKTITEAKNREIDEINKKYDEEDKKRRKENIDKNLSAVRDQFTAIGDLAMLFNAKSKEGQKKAFNVKKAADIASTTIDTYKSATSAYASMSGIAVVGPVLGAIAASVAVASGLMNIKKIAAQKFEGGSVPSGGGGGGGEGALSGGMSGGSQAPSFNVVGNNGLNQLSQLQQQPTQAYVVSGQVTTAQSLDRNRIQNATL